LANQLATLNMSNLISKILININCQAGQKLSDVQLSKFLDSVKWGTNSCLVQFFGSSIKLYEK